MFKEKLNNAISFTTSVLLISSCTHLCAAKLPEEEQKLRDKLYQAITDNYLHTAHELLDDLTLDYQSSSDQASYKMEAIYQSFVDGEYAKVSSMAESYRLAFPYDEHQDYVSYMQAFALYKMHVSGTERSLQHTMGLGVRDVEDLKQSKLLLDRLVQSDQASAYYEDAVILHKKVTDLVLDYDFSIAKSYRARGAYVSSQERLIDVLRSCYDKQMAMKVLHLMEDNYKSMKLDAFAKVVKRVLLLN